MDKFSICGSKQFMEATTIISFDPTSILGIEIYGCNKYWLIGACTRRKKAKM
jgi:hypothetical protein